MEKLSFQFQTQLNMSQPIHSHSFALRILPSSDEVQTICALNWQVLPAGNVCLNRDCFGNRYCMGSVLVPHQTFAFQVSGVAFVDGKVKRREGLHPIYRYESRLTHIGSGLHSFNEACCRAFNGGALERAVQLMQLVYDSMCYQPGVTGIKTTAEESFSLHAGVCQDYAHILIALCRKNQIPARYVAGMMRGEGATHAWVEIYDGGCWYALDPTHNRIVDDGYIKLAHGRDYQDCAIDRGCFKGYALQEQHVSVTVRAI